MASKSFSFRLPDEIVQFVESSQLESETLNQTAQRLFIDFVKRNNPLSTGLHTIVDIDEFKQQVEASLTEVRSQLEELRGKLKAR
jgi:dynactin complex subunit